MLKKFNPGYNIDPRELGNVKYKNQIVNLFLDAIQPNTEAGEAPLLPIINPNKPLGSSKGVDFSTTKDCYLTSKSHVNFVAVDSTWEASAAFRLEHSDLVKSYVRNDGLWFTIPYHFAGATRDYVPDFIVILTNDTRLIVEIKGQETMQDQAKYQAARRWVKAVNHSQKYGTWDFLVCRNPRTVAYEIERYE
jgi:type III restriction enzyme